MSDYDYWQAGVHRGENGRHMLCLCNVLYMTNQWHATIEQMAHARTQRTLDLTLWGNAPRLYTYIQVARVRFPRFKSERADAHYSLCMEGFYSSFLRES